MCALNDQLTINILFVYYTIYNLQNAGKYTYYFKIFTFSKNRQCVLEGLYTIYILYMFIVSSRDKIIIRLYNKYLCYEREGGGDQHTSLCRVSSCRRAVFRNYFIIIFQIKFFPIVKNQNYE